MNITRTQIVAVIAMATAGTLMAENVAKPKSYPDKGEAPTPGVEEKIDPAKELFIIAPEVINSDRAKKKDGPWHIRGALQRIAGNNADGTPVDVESFAKAWFKTWADDEAIEGVDDAIIKRPWVADALSKAWQEDRIRLIAIVNRIDLTKFPNNDPTQPPIMLGEGRFVYEVMKDATNSEPFTLIFEYRLPGDSTLATLQQWAKDWHKLGKSATIDEEYLKTLEGITNRYSAHGTLNQVRSNEFLDRTDGQPKLWELREFHFDAAKQKLKHARVNLTPAFKLKGTPKLQDFVRATADSIIGGRHETIPMELVGATAPTPFQFTWNIFDNQATPDLQRAGFIVSFNSCNGCHSADTGTLFQHIGKNAPDMSPFLKGPVQLAQKLPGQNSTEHNEMEIRKQMLQEFLAGPSAFDDPVLKANVKARASRVH